MRLSIILVLLSLSAPVEADDKPPLDIEVRAKVKLVHYKVRAEGETIDLGLAIDGKAAFVIRNVSVQPVTFEDLEAGNVAFLDPASGKSWPMVHPCAVVGACSPDGPVGRKFVTLQPGQEHTVQIDEFGCSGSYWRAPPRGNYDLVYRVRIINGDAPKPPWCPTDDAVSPNAITKAAREALGGKAFWKGSVSSRPMRVHFKKVRTKYL